MKCSLGISNFLEEVSSLSHSVVFLYFFALIAEEGFLPGLPLKAFTAMQNLQKWFWGLLSPPSSQTASYSDSRQPFSVSAFVTIDFVSSKRQTWFNNRGSLRSFHGDSETRIQSLRRSPLKSCTIFSLPWSVDRTNEHDGESLLWLDCVTPRRRKDSADVVRVSIKVTWNK